jgi:hypothetical protein
MSSEDGGTYINYACPACYKLSQSRIESEAKTSQGVDDLTVYIMFLRCAKSDCQSPVILLAPMKKDVSEPELRTHIREAWSTHSAACAKGHPPLHPYEVRIWKLVESER